MSIKKQTLITILISLLCISCASDYAVKPLDDKASVTKILAKDPTSAAFNDYLLEVGYATESLPLTAWGIDELTLCALFYHTKLEVAKQQLALSQLEIQTAGIRNVPSINGEFGQSNQKNGDLSPWLYGLSLNIPIETTNKRSARVAKAEQNAEVARMDMAEIAWQLRNQIAIDLIDYHQNLAEVQLLQQEVETQESITNMLEKRVNAGLASSTELSNVSLLSLKAKHQLNNKQTESRLIKAKLAADVGLTPENFASIQIKPLDIEPTLSQQAIALDASLDSKILQQEALLNRIDIRRSLAQYAAAETEIKLQVAQQTPDITLSPGILFEFGDKIWSLGFSSLLKLLHKDTALVDQAKQLREVQGAQFEDLQATVIAQINQLHAHYQSAKQASLQAENTLKAEVAQEQKMRKQFESGLIGKREFAQYSLNTLIAKQQQLTAQFTLLHIANQIENAMQKPIYTDFKMPNSTVTRLSSDE